MHQYRIAWVVLGLAMAIAPQVAAEDFSYAAEPARKKFDAKVAELRAKYQMEVKATVADYTAKLDEAIKTATDKGDLDKVLAYKADVVGHQFPSDAESYHLPKETQAALETVLQRKRALRR